MMIGTETHADIRHVVFSNIVVRDSNKVFGINVQDGGTVSDVRFSNVTFETNRRHWNWWGSVDWDRGEAEPAWQSALVLRDVEGLDLQSFMGEAGQEGPGRDREGKGALARRLRGAFPAAPSTEESNHAIRARFGMTISVLPRFHSGNLSRLGDRR